jgi:RNA polymerase sigma factor (TIGR02999 family)
LICKFEKTFSGLIEFEAGKSLNYYLRHIGALFRRGIMAGSMEVTRLLQDWRQGDNNSLERMMPLVYEELRRIADRHMRRESPGHTLQPTALAHEAFMNLVDVDVTWSDRVHFYAVSVRIMRRLLVDHAKAKYRKKRGGDLAKVSLEDAVLIEPEPSPELIELDEALGTLEKFDERKSQVVELHYFGGFSYEEIADVLGISAATVHRELRLAKAWLYGELQSPNETE